MFMAPAGAVAQAPATTPSAQELWDRYPLAATPEAVPSATVSVTVPAAADPARRPPAAAEPAASTGALAPLVALGIVLCAATAVVLSRRRRTHRPPHTPATLIARPAAVRAAPPDPRGPPATPPGAPPNPGAPWSAEIEWSAEGGTARFLVVATRKDTGAATVVAASPAVPWPPAGEDAIDALAGAADRLEATLLAAGWFPCEPGAAWYARRFGWTPARRFTHAARATEEQSPTSRRSTRPAEEQTA